MSRMKKIFASALGLMMFTSMMPATLLANETDEVAIVQENFPDANFLEYVKKFDLDKNTSLSLAERNAVKTMNCEGMYTQEANKIKDFTGIEYFTELEELHAYGNGLTTLELDNPKLSRLYCFSNELTTLTVTSQELTILDCANNNLESFDVQSPKLIELYCDNNALTSLDISVYPDLIHLRAACNYITDIDTSANLKLKDIHYPAKEIEMDVREGFDYTKVPTLDEFSDRFFKFDGYYTENLTVDPEAKTVTLDEDVDYGVLILQLEGSNRYEFTFYYGENPNKPDVDPDVDPDDPADKPIVTPDTKPEVKPDVKPEIKPEVKPEVKPEIKPEVKPTNTKKPAVVENQKAPQTADSSHLGSWMVLMAIAAVTGFGAFKHNELE